MASGLDAFLAAIAQQESGGSYSAVNPSSGALGKYQVMPSNVASWTRRALGYSLTPSQYLQSPSAQEAVAQTILGGYYNSYGAAGAAAMWYSGQSDPHKTYGDPPVYQYVNDILSHMGSAPAGGGGGGGVGAVTPALDANTLASMYGLSSATINANGEIKRLFQQAVAGQWTADRFTAALKNTNWWRTTSDAARQFFILKSSDPATFAAKWQQTAMHVNDLAVKLGVWNMASEGTSFGGKMDQLLRRGTTYAMQEGWNDAQLTDWLGQYVRVNNGVMWGAAGDAWDSMHQYAYSQGMQYQWQWYYDNARKVVSGQTTLENAQATIRHQAAAKYSAWADQINAGQSALDLASPYIQAVSQILEVPQGQIDLFNQHVNQAMTSKSTGGYPLWQFENDLRNDPTWVKTNNARESMMTVAHGVLKDFGLAY